MNVQTIRALFSAFVAQPWNDVASFIMSDDNRTLQQQPGQVYPQLQLDPPRYTPKLISGRSGKKTYRMTAAILAPAARDDYDAQDRATEEMERQMDLLISWLERRRKSQDLRITGLGECYPISYGEHASLFGWALPIDMEVNQVFCVSEASLHQVKLLQVIPNAAENTLNLRIDSTDYSVPWTPLDGIHSRLDELVRQVNEGGHALTASRDIEVLVLTGTIAAQAMSIDTNQGGHGWSVITI